MCIDRNRREKERQG